VQCRHKFRVLSLNCRGPAFSSPAFSTFWPSGIIGPPFSGPPFYGPAFSAHPSYLTNALDGSNAVNLKLYSVSQPPDFFLTFFTKRLEIFTPNFICLLYVPIYAGLLIFIQLPATLTKLCHIKRDHHYYAQNVHHRPKCTLGGCT